MVSNLLDINDLQIARQDPAVGLMPIVRPVRDGQRPPALDVEIKHDGYEVRVAGAYMMRAIEQSVLLALMYLAAGDGESADASAALNVKGKACGVPVVRVATTYYRLARLIYGVDGGDRYAAIEEALFRLSNLTIRVRKDRNWGISHLISSSGQRGEEIVVELNWRLAETVTGADVRRSPVSLNERRALAQSELAQILHAFLSSAIKPGCEWTYRLDSLARRVWGDEKVSPEAARVHRHRVKAALQAVGQLPGWDTRFGGRGAQAKALIARGEAKRTLPRP